MVPSADGFLGKVVGGYTLTQLLGSSDTDSVYLGVKDDAAGTQPEQAAIKLLLAPQETAANRVEFWERFRREAKAWERLQHPHILRLLDYGEDAALGLPYLVLPYLRGGTLEARLAGGPLPLAEAVRYGEQIATALDYAHSKGIVYRDLNPANVLLDERGEAYLADFGIARIFDPANTTLTATGPVMGMGTPDYVSPEQARGERAGPEADVYALGMVLYQLTTGRVPFEGKSLAHVLMQIITEPPTPPDRLRPDLPEPAGEALLRALAKRPADRFATPGELAAAFALGVKGEGVPGLQDGETSPGVADLPTLVADPLPFPSTDSRARERGDETAFSAAPPLEQVTFTSYLPREVSPLTWEPLLIYFALDDPKSAAHIVERAAERLQERVGSFRNVTTPSRVPLRRGTRLTIVPHLRGFCFDPATITALWTEDVQCYEFRLRAERAELGQAANGVIHILEGPLLRGAIPISVFVQQSESRDQPLPDPMAHFAMAHTLAYRNTFPSYSRKDERIVRAFEAVTEASGDRFLRDVRALRAGQNWAPALLDLIAQSDVFQLFWSRPAAQSVEVGKEWRHAMTFLPAKPTFIRPVYWTPKPYPIPPELMPLNFGHLEPEVLGLARPSLLQRIFGAG
jgi:serine/threonine protein kinase